MLLFTIVFWIISLVLVSWVWSNSHKLSQRTIQLYLLLATIGFIVGTLLYRTDFQALTLVEENGDTNYNVLVNLNSQAIGDKIRVVAGGPSRSEGSPPRGAGGPTSTTSTESTPPNQGPPPLGTPSGAGWSHGSSIKTYLVNLPTPLNDSSIQVKVALKGNMCTSSGVNTFDCSAQTNVSASRTFVVASSIASGTPTGGTDPLVALGPMVDNSNSTPLQIATVSSLGSNNLVIVVDPGTGMFSGTLGCQLITTSPTDGLVVIQDMSDRPSWNLGYKGVHMGTASLNTTIANSMSINGARLKNRSRR